MDPDACLDRFFDALMRKDWSEVREASSDYRSWVTNGGCKGARHALWWNAVTVKGSWNAVRNYVIAQELTR